MRSFQLHAGYRPEISHRPETRVTPATRDPYESSRRVEGVNVLRSAPSGVKSPAAYSRVVRPTLGSATVYRGGPVSPRRVRRRFVIRTPRGVKSNPSERRRHGTSGADARTYGGDGGPFSIVFPAGHDVAVRR